MKTLEQRFSRLFSPSDLAAARGLAADRDRLEAAGHPVGTLPAAADAAALAESLCGWAALLDLL